MSNKSIKHVIDVPEDIYVWLRKIQAGIKFKYNKTVSQIQVALHLPYNGILPEDYDKAVDKLYESITKYESEKSNNKKKDNGSSVSE